MAIVAQVGQKTGQAAAWWLESSRHEDDGQNARSTFRTNVEDELRRVADELGVPIEVAMAEWKAILKRERDQRRS